MLGVISNILAFLTTRFGATSTSGSGNSEVKRAWVRVVPGWVTLWEVSHQVVRNKSVRYTLVKSRGKADNIVVEVGRMLQILVHAFRRKPIISFIRFTQTQFFRNSPILDRCFRLSPPHRIATGTAPRSPMKNLTMDT